VVRQDRARAEAVIVATQAEIEQAVIEAYANGCVDSLWQTIQGLRSMSVAAGALPAAADDEDARDAEAASS
jgi:hypothetical protein